MFLEMQNFPYRGSVIISPNNSLKFCSLFLVACTRLYTPLCPSVGRLVGRSRFTFFYDFILLPHCSCPNGLVTSNMAPAHPHATSVAVYPALLILNQCMLIFSISSEKSLNLFDFVLILDNFKAMYLIAVSLFFNNQKIGEKCDPMRSSRMIFVNPFKFESSFNVGSPLKI